MERGVGEGLGKGWGGLGCLWLKKKKRVQDPLTLPRKVQHKEANSDGFGGFGGYGSFGHDGYPP